MKSKSYPRDTIHNVLESQKVKLHYESRRTPKTQPFFPTFPVLRAWNENTISFSRPNYA